MKKRGYFFVIDSIVAMSILVIGVILIFSYHESPPSTKQSFTISQEVLNTLQKNKIKNLNDPYAGPNGILFNNGNITDVDKTLLEQAGEFYYRNLTKNCGYCKNLLSSFLGNVSHNLGQSQYNFEIFINNESVYYQSSMDITYSSFITPSRAIIHGIYNNNELYGPYVIEVLSWG